MMNNRYKRDVQYWYSNDTDVEATGSDKNDNESDDVIVKESNSDDGQLGKPDEQYWFPKSWFPYMTLMWKKSNTAEGQLGKQDADDVVVEESDSEVRESHHESPSLSSANQRAVASQ
ncbi:Hypothetical predicted protein, partial [Paramuricea clavata]